MTRFPTSADIAALADKVLSLSPPARLRLAAELLEQRNPDAALAVAKSVVLELEALRLSEELARFVERSSGIKR